MNTYTFVTHYIEKNDDDPDSTGINYTEGNIFRSFYDLESGVDGLHSVHITTGENLQYKKPLLMMTPAYMQKYWHKVRN